VTNGYLSTARGSAAAINFNVALILFPVCRNLVSFARNLFPGSQLKKIFDANIKAHKLISYVLLFWTVVHILAHYLNIYNFSDSWERSLLTEVLSSNPSFGLNPLEKKSHNLILATITLKSGYTGLILVLTLFFMRSAAAEPIKRSYYELFIFVHQLFWVFFPLLWIHGSDRIIKRQVNLADHNPELCSQDPEIWGYITAVQCPHPVFEGLNSSTPYWIMVSVIAYLIEIILRIVHTFNRANIDSFKFHSGSVLEIRLRKNQFSFRGNHHEVGQYVQIKVIGVSMLEWHPFTLTSAPEDGFFMVHIRVSGNWTGKVYKYFHEIREQNLPLPKIAVEGPFGTSSQDIFDYETVVCCGAGIGITPFASFLRSLLYLYRANVFMKTKKIYFVWISKSISSFEWFHELLTQVEQEIEFVEPQLYLTMSDMNHQQAVALQHSHNDTLDPVTGLHRWRTNYGRPIWDNIFSKVALENRGEIGMFACGPKPLTNQLKQYCVQYSDEHRIFKFHKENFN